MEKTLVISRQLLIHSTRREDPLPLIHFRCMGFRLSRLFLCIRNLMQQEYRLWS